MPEFSLSSESGHIDLGDGYVLHTESRVGTARVDAPVATRDLTSAPFEAALSNAGLHLDKTIVLPALPAAAGGARALEAGPGAAATSVLEVDVAPDQSCVLLVEDLGNGALAWVIPESDSNALQTRALTNRGATLRFRIPPARPAPPETRGLLDSSQVGQKISSFVFKITDELLGPIVHGFAKKWEVKHRPTFVRTFRPDDYQSDDPNFPHLDDAGWRRLSQGRALPGSWRPGLRGHRAVRGRVSSPPAPGHPRPSARFRRG